MYSLDLQIEEGEVGKCRIALVYGVTKIPLTDWRANAHEAVVAYSNALLSLTEHDLSDRLDRLTESVNELTRTKAVETKVSAPKKD